MAAVPPPVSASDRAAAITARAVLVQQDKSLWTYAREGRVARFIGGSGDKKPYLGLQLEDPAVIMTDADLPVGSTFFETDTGNIYRWSGAAWTLPQPAEPQAPLLQALSELKVEIVALRMGMIEAGLCTEFAE